MRKFLLVILVCCSKYSHSQSDTLKPGTIVYFVHKAIAMAYPHERFEQAIVIIDSAIAIDSNNTTVYEIKSEFLWMMKNYYQAALNYQKALLLDTDHRHLYGAYLFLGVLYEKAGRREEAQTQYLKAIYFLEHRKRKDDRIFADLNKADYAVALKLAGRETEWEKLLSDPSYENVCEKYCNRNRDEVLKIYWKFFDGG